MVKGEEQEDGDSKGGEKDGSDGGEVDEKEMDLKPGSRHIEGRRSVAEREMREKGGDGGDDLKWWPEGDERKKEDRIGIFFDLEGVFGYSDVGLMCFDLIA
ncbi:hypothetical protein Ancab_031815 [Ancistrocladus abbreviatus]